MLEVKNLKKVYKTKGGQEVRALDGVTLSFEDKGMVFLLGKSGSGKSTLLNICGGLDSPDSGEIIVKGKSSKDFSPSDFDSYRNTFIGFIFQEYNILNEFSVEENIALALELQGKPKDNATISKILEDVELANFAKRKPNTLSGGQKQRVAIARALIKNPEIIMADEPTGALDSRTGKQVFDTLKKLSKDKLVIIVSHDREFAEEYADRIIELRDGKVISDVIKSSMPANTQKDGNISIVGENTLLIKKGCELTKTDISDIKKFISECEEDVLISKNSQDISEFKKTSKINDDNSKDYFEALDTQPVQKAYTKEDSKFIRSRLPMRHAIKIGASGIKVKPMRFVFTVFLSVIAFVMFGLFSCLMFYNAEDVNSQSLYDAKEEYFVLSKTYDVHNEMHYPDEVLESISQSPTMLTKHDIELLEKNYKIIPVYADNLHEVKMGNLSYSSMQSFYSANIKGIVAPSDNLNYVLGSAPQSETQIAVSQFVWDSIKAGTLTDESGNAIIVNDSLQNVKIKFFDKYFELTGVFENQTIPDKYLALKKSADTKLAMDWSNQLQYGSSFINYICMPLSAYNSIRNNYGFVSMPKPGNSYSGMNVDFATSFFSISTNSINYPSESYSYMNNKGEIVQAQNLTNSIIMPYSSYIEYLNSYVQDYITTNSDYELMQKLEEEGISQDIDAIRSTPLSNEELTTKFKKVLSFVSTNIPDFNPTINMTLSNSTSSVNIAGLMLDINSYQLLTFSEDLIQTYKTASIADGYFNIIYSNFSPKDLDSAIYSKAFVSTKGFEKAQYASLVNFKTTPDAESSYQYNNALYDSISMYTLLASSLSKVFLWIGIVMAIFAMLLLFNFITVSISHKKKEIGILRAVGARGSDVFKIFFSESAIIVAICSIIAIILTGVLSAYINNVIATNLGMQISFFVFGFVSVAMILGIAIVTSLVSTFLPVFKASRKKPVESIRSL